jgi:hypothetical protein
VNLTATDNVDGDITVSPTAQITPGTSPNDFVMLRTWTFSDVAGNTSSVSQLITVLDDVAPVPPAPPADITVQGAAQVPAPVALTATDNCDGDLTALPSAQVIPGSGPDDFVIVRTWTFTDQTGNTSSVSQVITVVPPPVPQEFTIFINDEDGFNAAVGSAALVVRGTENFETSTVASGQSALVNDPLSPGSANGPFPNGTNPSAGVTIQSNTGGGSAGSLMPRGGLSLFTWAAGYFSAPNDQLVNAVNFDSIDLLFFSASPAVSLTPLFIGPPGGEGTAGTVIVTVYDQFNAVLGSASIAGVNFQSPAFVGVVAGPGATIGRINLWGGGATGTGQGADDIVVYTSAVP